MKTPRDWKQMRERIIGLGEESSRKSFYPELQQRLVQLDSTRENLRTVFNAIPDAIFILDMEGHVLEVNDAMLAMFGVTRETFGHYSMADYAVESGDGSGREERRLAERKILEAEGRLIREWTARRPGDGGTFEVEGAFRFAHWYDREVLLAVVRDITERKRLEAMLHQSQKLDALGQFAGGMAHDTNNMLGVIIGYVDLLEEDLAGSESALADLGQIRKAALRSSDLIRQLLAFARKQAIQPRVLDLNEQVEETQRMLRRLIGENITLLWKPSTPLGAIWADPSQIDQILANLTVNARDAISGSGSITLETANLEVDGTFCLTHPDAVPGSYVALSVTDTGCGMTPEVQARIFDPFFTTKEAGHGTGLGLAMVYGILRQNRGFITVYSAPSVGTTFRLHFPRHLEVGEESTGKGAEEAAVGGHETILLVEDESTLLDLEIALLEGAGYRVISASHPRQAQALAQQETEPIHLLVTDLVMPGMNGQELHQWIRSVRPEARCLFMSGYPSEALGLQQDLEMGSDFIQKPFNRGDFLRKVRSLLDLGPA